VNKGIWVEPKLLAVFSVAGGPLMDDFDRFWQKKPLDSALIVPQAAVVVSKGISSWTVTPFGVLDATAMRPPS
jgi:hypothetical protein